MIILFLLALGGGVHIEPLDLPQNTNVYWEDMIPLFQDSLESDYGEVAVKFAPWVLEAHAHYGISPVLLSKLIFKESSFRTKVTSSSGAVGPAQIKPKFWKDFCGAYNLRDPKDNVLCSAQILAYLASLCGDMECAVNYYNVGHTGRASPSYIGYILNNS